ncbi:MAG: tRNA (adenosine(37)-N6)-dimethylallyltransferase MiaA, partial [Solirubrobacteraceae bacterium]|nr:tRNA (adenosine(37)-N6)-dimethylallyltransferase MiaA [Solirubrobacteraceae bacterium]
SEFSAGQYAQLAHEEIDRAIEGGELAIVVGGTGLYLQAALTMPMRPPISQSTEQALQEQLETEGEQALHERLAAQSPTAAARINASDHRRLLRALALLAEGHSLEDQDGGIWTSQLRHPTRLIGLTCDRDELYA